MTMRLLHQPPVQPRRHIDQELTQSRALEMGGKFPVDQQRTPIMRLPMTVSRGQFTSLFGLHREMRAVALCAKLDVAVGIEPEIVAAGNVVQPSFLDLEILTCGA